MLRTGTEHLWYWHKQQTGSRKPTEPKLTRLRMNPRNKNTFFSAFFSQVSGLSSDQIMSSLKVSWLRDKWKKWNQHLGAEGITRGGTTMKYSVKLGLGLCLLKGKTKWSFSLLTVWQEIFEYCFLCVKSVFSCFHIFSLNIKIIPCTRWSQKILCAFYTTLSNNLCVLLQ